MIMWRGGRALLKRWQSLTNDTPVLTVPNILKHFERRNGLHEYINWNRSTIGARKFPHKKVTLIPDKEHTTEYKDRVVEYKPIKPLYKHPSKSQNKLQPPYQHLSTGQTKKQPVYE